MLSPVWDILERKRERKEGLTHMQMEVYRGRARERNRVTARISGYDVTRALLESWWRRDWNRDEIRR